MKRGLKMNVALREQLFQLIKLWFSAVLGFTFGRDSTDGGSWLSDR